mmetsp:Transcript_4071/g.6427  ORF Transcript_4071/g.6427 Transcript_4071/m.6427 type:complete len:468 (-) Transcript_4071:357-1760(-)
MNRSSSFGVSSTDSFGQDGLMDSYGQTGSYDPSSDPAYSTGYPGYGGPPNYGMDAYPGYRPVPGETKLGRELQPSCYCMVTVDAAEVGVVSCFGKFQKLMEPGLSCICCCGQKVEAISTRVEQINVTASTKTKDHVSVTAHVAVQVAVDRTNAANFMYNITEPHRQVVAFVEDSIRSTIPSLTMEETFASKQVMANNIQTQVGTAMTQFGLVVHSALVTDLKYDQGVLDAMNEVQTAKRDLEATINRAAALKSTMVKKAEAEAEAKHLSGIGTAKMRKAIVEGFQNSVEDMSNTGLEMKESVVMMLAQNYLEVVKDFADSGCEVLMTHTSALGPAAASVPFIQNSMASPDDVQPQVKPSARITELPEGGDVQLSQGPAGVQASGPVGPSDADEMGMNVAQDTEALLKGLNDSLSNMALPGNLGISSPVPEIAVPTLPGTIHCQEYRRIRVWESWLVVTLCGFWFMAF